MTTEMSHFKNLEQLQCPNLYVSCSILCASKHTRIQLKLDTKQKLLPSRVKLMSDQWCASYKYRCCCAVCRLVAGAR